MGNNWWLFKVYTFSEDYKATGVIMQRVMAAFYLNIVTKLTSLKKWFHLGSLAFQTVNSIKSKTKSVCIFVDS